MPNIRFEWEKDLARPPVSNKSFNKEWMNVVNYRMTEQKKDKSKRWLTITISTVTVIILFGIFIIGVPFSDDAPQKQPTNTPSIVGIESERSVVFEIGGKGYMDPKEKRRIISGEYVVEDSNYSNVYL